MYDGRTTITQFIIEEQRQFKEATGDFTSLLNDVERITAYHQEDDTEAVA